MTTRFSALNSGMWVGVVDHQNNDAWVIEPEYNWKTAQIMAECLEADPDLDPDELTKLVQRG